MNANVSRNKFIVGIGMTAGIFSLLFGALILTSLLSNPLFDLMNNLLSVAFGSILFAVGIVIFVISSEGL